MKGKFIVFEGGDGAGKDTQIDLLKKTLPAEEFLFTREPGGTDLGKELRHLLLESSYDIDDVAEAFMFLADRAQHTAKLIRPSLEKGVNVISNRSWISFVAYQIYGRQQEYLLPLIEFAHREIYKDLEPDLVIFLDIEPEEGILRSEKRGDMNSIDRAPLEFHRRVQQGFYTALNKAKKVDRIDAAGSVEDIHKRVYATVKGIVN